MKNSATDVSLLYLVNRLQLHGNWVQRSLQVNEYICFTNQREMHSIDFVPRKLKKATTLWLLQHWNWRRTNCPSNPPQLSARILFHHPTKTLLSVTDASEIIVNNFFFVIAENTFFSINWVVCSVASYIKHVWFKIILRRSELKSMAL